MQVLQWKLDSGAVEQLVGGEVRTIAFTLAPDTPASATVRVVQKSTGTVLVATTPATTNGSVVSYLLTVPLGIDDTIDIIFLCVMGTETIGVDVRAQVVQ